MTVTSDNPLVDKGSCTVTTNSLFADLKDGDTAELRYGASPSEFGSGI